VNLALDGIVPVGTPRLMSLFLRQRAFLATLLILLALDGILLALTRWVEAEGGQGRLGHLLMLAPCVIPAVIGTAMWSRGADMESNVPFPLQWARLIHLTVLVAVGIGGSALVVGSWLGRVEHVHQGAHWLRYSLVTLSVALIGARLIGARFAWVAPLMIVVVAFFAHMRFNPVEPLGFPWWLWMLRRTDDGLSWAITSALVFVAIPVFARSGPRVDEPGEG
jgi:hypothetical protein